MPEAHPVIVTAPGEEAQVDYGTGPTVRDHRRQVPPYPAVRAHARLQPQVSPPADVPIQFPHLGELMEGLPPTGRCGSHHRAMLDNLREGVLVPDHDPLNPLYRDVLAHYGVVGMPCRVQHPDRKGEEGVGHAQKTPLKGCASSLEQAQAYLDRWETHWADTRIHGTTKRQVAAMFMAEETGAATAATRALPLLPIRRTHRASGRLCGNRCRLLWSAAGLDRSAGQRAVGRPLRAPARSTPVNCCASMSARTRPLSHQAGGFTPSGRRSARCSCWRGRAERRHSCIGALWAIHRAEGELGVRRILGVLALAKEVQTG